MEYFEITFFGPKSKYEEAVAQIISEEFKRIEPLITELLLDYFDDDKDFIEYRVSMGPLEFTRETLAEVAKELSQCVGGVFRRVDCFFFATGMYLLTYCYTEHVKFISEFDERVLPEFPFVFYRTSGVAREGTIIYQDENVVCIYQKYAQYIYPQILPWITPPKSEW